jgi:PAS domain S-box-containing protein
LQKEELYQRVFEASEDLVIVTNQQGTILLATRAVQQQLGYSVVALEGGSIRQLFTGAGQEAYSAATTLLDEGGKRQVGLEARHSNGTVLPVVVHLQALVQNQTKIIISTLAAPQWAGKGRGSQIENKYHFLFESHLQPMWIYDAETLGFMQVNNAAIHHYGFTRAEFLSMTLKDIRPPEEVTQKFLDIAFDENAFNDSGPWIHRKKNGELIWVKVIIHTMAYEGRPSKLVLAIDVTETRNAEEQGRKLAEDRERLLSEVLTRERMLTEAEHLAQMGSWQYNPVAGTVIWSDESYRIFGYKPGEVAPSYELFLHHVHPEDLTHVTTVIEGAVGNATDAELEFRITDQQNKSRFIYSRVFAKRVEPGAAVQLNGFNIDITEKKESALLLAKTAQRYQQMVENVSDAIMVDDEDGKIVFANKKFLELFGCTGEEVTSLYLEDYVAPPYRQQLRAWHNRRVRGEEAPELIEYEGVNKNGEYIWLEVKVSTLTSNGVNTGTESVIRDVTERKMAEIGLSRAMQQIEASNKELEQFAYMVSHDLQEPLRMVIGFLNLLNIDYGQALDDEAKEYIHFAVDGASRMKLLIEDLLVYSRVGRSTEQLAPVNLNEVMQYILQVQQENSTAADAQIQVDQLPTVMGIETLLTQLMMNLVSNAIKYHGAAPVRIRVGATDETDRWKIYVSDNGIGIEPTHFERIFVIFQRLHSRSEYPGTGLGLAICRKIAEKHGGTIWVDSVPGSGSTFFFTILKKAYDAGSEHLTGRG